MDRLTVCDFFCGAGGFSEGFYQAGFNVIFGLDNWNPAVVTHKLNHPDCKVIKQNILELDTPQKIDKIVPNTNIIIGSPPCVSFSNSNMSGKADKTLGVQLIHAFLRIIAYKRSKGYCTHWIMENVPNSLKHIQDKYTWEELGLPGNGPDLVIPYKDILLASDYGAPQDRKRAICGNCFPPEKINTKKTIHYIMDMLGDPCEQKKESYTDCIYGDVVDEVTDHLYDTTIPDYKWKKAKRLKLDHGYMGKMSFPDKLDRCCRTIMATQSCSTRESIIFPKENCKDQYRSPTIREISCLMGFPISYQFSGKSDSSKHKQIGNAVCPPLAKALGYAILKHTNRPQLSPMKRKIQLAPFNLNGRPLKIAIEKPRRITSKYSIHIPYLKISTLRVELSNKSSNFKDGEYKWKSILHRGAGKNARKCELSNNILEAAINNSIFRSQFTEYKNAILLRTQNAISSSEEFQKKMCRIPTSTSHKSPNEILDIIKKCVDEYINVPDTLEMAEMKKSLMKSEIPIKIIFGFWGLNNVVERLS